MSYPPSGLPIGTNRCLCRACGRRFGGVSGFDLHQRDGEDGRPVCQDPATVVDRQGRRLLFERDGYWKLEAPAAFSQEPGLLGQGSAKHEREAVEPVPASSARQAALL